MTPDDALAEVRRRAAGRTRHEGQAPRVDEMLAEEVERLREALREAERKLAYADRESNPHDLADWARGALEDVRRALGEDGRVSETPVAMDIIKEAAFNALARHIAYLRNPKAGSADDANRMIDDIAATVAVAVLTGDPSHDPGLPQPPHRLPEVVGQQHGIGRARDGDAAMPEHGAD